MSAHASAGSMSVSELTVKSLGDKQMALSQYVGKVSLMVNTASMCGYTGQYKELQEIYLKYKDQGFVILGFPSNDFGKQEPGSDKDIKEFCDLKYRVTFPMFTKGAVTGPDKQEVYRVLTEGNPALKGEVKWNFEKFLINKKGEAVARFPSSVKPDDSQLVKKLEEELGKK